MYPDSSLINLDVSLGGSDWETYNGPTVFLQLSPSLVMELTSSELMTLSENSEEFGNFLFLPLYIRSYSQLKAIIVDALNATKTQDFEF